MSCGLSPVLLQFGLLSRLTGCPLRRDRKGVKMIPSRFVFSILYVFLISGQALAADSVVVNGQALPFETVRALEQAYSVRIAPDRYWYDPYSGAWGFEGGPIAGQLMPGLSLGGPLRADASRGNTQVFVNGRELTMTEVMGLQRACNTTVYRGRYWVNAQGIGGIEGGPPYFNLAACGSSSGGSSTRTYCDNEGNCSSHGLWGWISTQP
jgi:hypothetical protein